MTTAPQWSPVDDDTTDLLHLVAMGSPSTGTADQEWQEYVRCLEFCATADDGLINPNTLRVLVRDVVAPRRVGAFANKALRAGLIEWRGEWVVSDDSDGKNAGKPAKVYRLVGGAR